MSFKLAHANTPEASRLGRAFKSWIVEKKKRQEGKGTLFKCLVILALEH